jgi:hypothetical protein
MTPVVQTTVQSGAMHGTEITQRPSLLRAEALRLASRRLVRLLLVLGFAGLLVGSVLIFFSTGKPSASEISAAKAQAQQMYQSCISSIQGGQAPVPAPGSGSTTPGSAGSPTPGPVPSQMAAQCQIPYRFLLHTQMYHAATSVPNGAMVVLGGFAVLFFMIGATAGGAEWAAKTLPSLLTWEPRRIKVIITKLLVLSGFALIASVLAAALWLGLALLIAHFHGEWSERPATFWKLLMAQEGKGVLLVVLAASVGYSLAHMIRNTGALLGIAFVYLVMVENAVRVFIPRLNPWLIANNIAALLLPHGIDVQIRRLPTFSTSSESVGPIIRHLSGLRGGAMLTVLTVAFVGAAVLIFRRRDLT